MHADRLIVGAVQAGLSLSHELKLRGVDHLAPEPARIGEA